jgi:hypothetical protein
LILGFEGSSIGGGRRKVLLGYLDFGAYMRLDWCLTLECATCGGELNLVSHDVHRFERVDSPLYLFRCCVCESWVYSEELNAPYGTRS